MSTVLERNQGGEMLGGPGGLFENSRNNVFTPQGRGQVFEHLIKAFLKDDPLFKERFSQVWLWAEWPSRNDEHDSGIGLVTKNALTVFAPSNASSIVRTSRSVVMTLILSSLAWVRIRLRHGFLSRRQNIVPIWLRKCLMNYIFTWRRPSIG